MHAGHPQKLHHLPDSSQGPCLASDLISPNVTTKKHPSYNKPIFLYKKNQLTLKMLKSSKYYTLK